MAQAAGLRELLRERWFGWLFATRLASQTADGVFQASLASAVFFNPDHQTHPRQVAAGFVVLLLPYSLVGPFAGVFLDRWRRQRVLVRANLIRSLFVVATAATLVTEGPHALAFYIAALCALSVNRFYLSALSASLPHVVARRQLLVANSLTTTTGTFVTVFGMGLGLLIRKGVGPADRGSAVVALSSVAVYLASAAVATRMPIRLLGPDSGAVPMRRAVRDVVSGLVAGARELARHRAAGGSLLAISGARLLLGVSTIGTLLLYRNYFHADGVLRAGLVGQSQALGASAIGYLVAASVTPAVTARIGKGRWIVHAFAGAAVVEAACGLPFAPGPLLVGAALLGFATQSTKICVDTIVQEDIGDVFRGRVFSFYDMSYNLTFVVAAVVGAFVLPENGKSYVVVTGLALGYGLIAAALANAHPRWVEGVAPSPAVKPGTI